MGEIKSFRDLRVYQKLKFLHFEVSRVSLSFPKFEMYEVGSQLRKSSNSAPALIAEGWGSRHTAVYIEAINRSMGEIRESQHHLDVARGKDYITEEEHVRLNAEYDHCYRMLEKLHQALADWQGTTRTGKVVKEESVFYGNRNASLTWEACMQLTTIIDAELD